MDSNHENANYPEQCLDIYSDKDCSELITEMPATDQNGSAVARDCKDSGYGDLKEITAHLLPDQCVCL